MSGPDTSVDLPLELLKPGEAAIPVLSMALGLPERDVARRLAQAFSMPYWETEQLALQTPAFDRLALATAQQRACVLLRRANAEDAENAENSAGAASFVGVISDPFDLDAQLRLEDLAGAPVEWVLATPADIRAYLNQQESRLGALDSLVRADGAPGDAVGGHAEVLSFAALSDAGSATVKLVNSTLYDALRAGASDVHFESVADGLIVKYRIDGMLDQIAKVSGVALAEQTMSRLKVLAELDIAERRVPQDGSFRVRAQGRDIDLRLSVMPSVHGEDAVVRVLDKQAIVASHGSLTLDGLGFDAASLRALRELTALPHGMLLVTGPTGSGKTTTLYAALSETYTGQDKIITIEDPVEYQLPGVLQIPVNERKGLTFARGLRSILRHDPDKIMVGEIRDRETAEIAVQSALTGHLVLTTVHANSVFDVFGRFTHMGLEPYALVSALNGIWAQRLVRVNCAHCSRPCVPDDGLLGQVEWGEVDLGRVTFMKGIGCGDCRGTGYKGRRAVAEILRLDDELREAIVARHAVRRIKQLARDKGTRTLAEATLALVATGQTTLEEARRVAMAS